MSKAGRQSAKIAHLCGFASSRGVQQVFWSNFGYPGRKATSSRRYSMFNQFHSLHARYRHSPHSPCRGPLVEASGPRCFGADARGELWGIAKIAGSGAAFCAVRADGSVVTWGDPRFGGEVPPEARPFLGSNALAFAWEGGGGKYRGEGGWGLFAGSAGVRFCWVGSQLEFARLEGVPQAKKVATRRAYVGLCVIRPTGRLQRVEPALTLCCPSMSCVLQR